MQRIRMIIQGAVQGVGFRPFVYRLAGELNLTGTVANTGGGVITEVQGPRAAVSTFIRRVVSEAPPVSHITSSSMEDRPPRPTEKGFVILHSDDSQEKTVTILPDISTCPYCLREIFAPRDRRHGYAFTNCTNCGPRFSIINDLPYDRPNTEMRAFTQCPRCEAEYGDPADRRFHAQPNACGLCGPRLRFSREGVEDDQDPLAGAVLLLAEGGILALKGIGGYQLLCDARSEPAVQELRRRKQREEKPLAVMFPSLDLAKKHCHMNAAEEALLQSPAAPIVLLRREAGDLAPAVAPGNPDLGVMLPYSPLHHLLMARLDFPVVCTSGNQHDEPIAFREDDARRRLAPLADAFLTHDRPIARHLDDSVARVTSRGEQYFRRARGYAPLPLRLQHSGPKVLAVGAHLKNTIAIAFNDQVILSQHIGDLSTPEAHDAFKQVVADLPRLYDFTPELVACDRHPDYLSSQYAHGLGLPVLEVQHHHAHVAAVLAEHQPAGPVLGAAWDGTGLGDDDTVWGGEFLLCAGAGYERVAWLDTFPLVGGDAAAREPRRSALGLLYELGWPVNFPHGLTPEELAVLHQALAQGINTVMTTSIGRLFDGVAALLDLRQLTAFEGQSAMALEFAAKGKLGPAYPFELKDSIDWRPMVKAIINDRDRGVAVGEISARFHGTLVEWLVAVARRVGVKQVALSGGCFQNRLLWEGGAERLEAAGFEVLLPRHLPVNDGAIAAGQAWVAGVR